MIIQFNESWRFRSEPLQWVVEKYYPKTEKNKSDSWQAKAYCGDLDSAIVWCGRRNVLELDWDSGADALNELVRALDNIQRAVEVACDRMENYAAAQRPEETIGGSSTRDF